MLQALRRATAGAHARLEAVTAMEPARLTRDRYGTMLQVLLAMRQGWEPGLERLFPGSVGPHRAWLAADLVMLGRARLAPGPMLGPDPDEGWGVRYVLEGSALGGRVLLRRVEPLGLTAERGARYFAGWGEETGPRWRAFLGGLQDAATPAALPGIVRGGSLAFAALLRLASARFDEGLDAGQDLAAPFAAVEDAVVADAGL